MRVLHLEASKGWGGQEIRILKEALGMRERGHEVIFGVMKGGALIQHAKNAGFVVYELNFKRIAWPWTFWRLLWIIFHSKIDLVNTHSSLDSWIGGIAARISRTAVIRTRHLSTPIKKGFNSRFVYNTLADFVVTTCAVIVPTIAKQSGKPLHLCRSIATGVEPRKITVDEKEIAEFRKKIGVSPSDFLVGTACMMRSWKGIDDLLKAADLLRDHPSLKFVIIGGGHVQRHKELAKALKLEKSVIFAGHLQNPFPAIASLDIFSLLSTAHEGVSQAILQAAFLGKPLIATETGGLQEVCLHEKTGLRVLPFAPEEVAKAILTIYKDPLLRLNFGQEAKKHVLNHFTFEKTLNEMEEVYELVGKRKKN